MTSTTQTPEAALVALQQKETAGDPLIARANSVAVIDAESAERAAAIMADIADAIKQIEAAIDPHIKRAHEVHKGLTQERKRQVEPLQSAIAVIKGRIGAWREAEQRAAREAAAAEARRIEAEARAERQRQIEEARAAGQTKRDAEMEARAAEQVRIAEARAAVATAAAPVVAGVKTRVRWVAEVTDMGALMSEIIEGVIPASVVEIKQAELNRVAAAWKNTRAFRGIRIKAVEEVVR
jgi:hypothetical protein